MTAIGALAQGQFTFGNKNATTTPPILAQVTTDGGPAVEGANFWAQAYVKLASAAADSYAPVGAAVNFRTGANAGYIVPVVVTTTFAGGTDVSVQMRAWAASGGNNYEAAAAAGAWAGTSTGVDLKVTVAPNTPPDMMGLQPFKLTQVPEPSTLALGVLGAAALLLRRRN